MKRFAACLSILSLLFVMACAGGPVQHATVLAAHKLLIEDDERLAQGGSGGGGDDAVGALITIGVMGALAVVDEMSDHPPLPAVLYDLSTPQGPISVLQRDTDHVFAVGQDIPFTYSQSKATGSYCFLGPHRDSGQLVWTVQSCNYRVADAAAHQKN